MKLFTTATLLLSSVASASLFDRSVNYLSRRQAAATTPEPDLLSRDPLPGQSGLATVLNALQVIKDLTVNSTYIIGNFTGQDLTAALAIQTATNVLNDATYNGSVACAQIDDLSVGDAETLGAFTQGLAYAVNASIATLISKKPDFEKLNIASVIPSSLEGLAFGSYVFSVTVLQKVPQELQGISAALSSQIGESINMGIQCFNGTNSSCITTIVNPDRTLAQAIANDTISGANSVQAGGLIALAIAVFAAIIAF